MGQHFFIRCDGKYIRIDVAHIRYVESLKNYVRIVTTGKAYLTLMTLGQLERELSPVHFCRVHRSYIIALAYISSFDHEAVYMDDVTIPISPAYRPALHDKVKVLVNETRIKAQPGGE